MRQRCGATGWLGPAGRALAGLGLASTLAAAALGAPVAHADPSPTASTPAAQGAPSAPVESKPVSLVVLVDESGSLSDADIAAERAAAALIAQSEIATRSQVSVVGFGGNNGRAGQSPVDLVCQPTTVASPTEREYLAGCVAGLHRRTEQEGNGTDFPRALSQALSALSGQPADQTKIIFLLTDGKLDVRADPSYGTSPDQRNATALAAMNGYLAQASSAGIQVWPLGFGTGPDESQLADFARRGSQRTCGHGSPEPRARVATGSDAVLTSLVEAYTVARCAASTPAATARLGSGSSVDLKVAVPLIATDGSLTVYKRDSRVAVQYYDPHSQLVPKSGAQGESTFQVSGEGSAVEVLRVVNPQPGTWTVRLTAGPGVPAQDVRAQVIWQGAIRSSVSLDPPAPSPGQNAVARVTLATRRSALTDPEALRQLSVSAQLAGDGFTAQQVPLADNGQAPDDTAGDGVFTGQLTMPTTATDSFRLVGFVGGAGISSDELPFDGKVNPPGSTVQVQVQVEPHRVAPGGALTGTVEASNTSGTAQRLRLVLTDLDPGTLATVTPPRYELPASGRTTFGFQILLDAHSQLGPAAARLQVLDDARPQAPGFADRRFTFVVAYPPPLWRRLLWLWLTLLGLAAAAVAVVVYQVRQRRAARDVAGLVMLLSRDGVEQNTYAAGAGDRFRFVLRDEETGRPRFDRAEPTDPAYVVQREGASVLVRLPHGGDLLLAPGRPRELPNGLELGFRDNRPPGRGPSRRRSPGQGSRRGQPERSGSRPGHGETRRPGRTTGTRPPEADAVGDHPSAAHAGSPSPGGGQPGGGRRGAWTGHDSSFPDDDPLL